MASKWKGRFVPNPLTVGPKDKRKADEIETGEEPAEQPVAKKAGTDRLELQTLMEYDSYIDSCFDKNDNDQVKALRWLAPFRYDVFAARRAAQPTFESVQNYLFVNDFEAATLVERVLELSQLTVEQPNTSGNSDLEAFLKLLFAETLRFVRGSTNDFVTAVYSLMLAQFEATDEIKRVIDQSNNTEYEDAFGDVLENEETKSIFLLLSKQTDRFTVEKVDLIPADIVQQRILSFLSDADFKSYCKTRKGLRDICESGVWKNTIADMRFERQFPNEVERNEILKLRARFYPEMTTLRSFKYAAIRAAKYLNQYAIESDTKYRLGRDELLFDTDRLLEIPVYLYLFNQKDAASAHKAFMHILLNNSATVQNVLIDSKNKIYDGTDIVKVISEISDDAYQRAVFVAIDKKIAKNIVSQNLENTLWTKLVINEVETTELETPEGPIFVLLSWWLTSEANVEHPEYRKVRRLLTTLLLKQGNVLSAPDLYDPDVAPAIWNDYVSAAFILYGMQNTPERDYGYRNTPPLNVFYVALKLRSSGKLDANLENQLRQYITDAFYKDITQSSDSMFYYGLNEVPSLYFDIDPSPELWMPLAEALSNAQGQDQNSVGLAAGWYALRLLRSESDIINESRLKLQRIAKEKLGRYCGNITFDARWHTTTLLRILLRGDDVGTWLSVLRVAFDLVVNIEARLQSGKRVDEGARYRSVERFYKLMTQMDKFDMLTEQHKKLFQSFISNRRELFALVIENE